MSILVIDSTIFNNQTIDGKGQVLTGDDCLVVKSKQDKNGKWLIPENITIKNFKVKGSIRIVGLGINGEAELVRLSSYNKNHTEYCQKVAPKNIVFDNIIIEANKRIPFYVAPGCTNITLQNSVFEGWSEATAIYLCCESANNKIFNNVFRTKTKRETIAIDGSAYNLIENNTFEYLNYGGIYVYRNSGEGRTVRHQTPSYNKIINNTFSQNNSLLAKLKRIIYPTVWLGSRSYFIQYFIKFRNDDKGYAFGSSVNNTDHANNNIVESNQPKNIYIRNWQTS
jgi:parallel beta-helix repeat protein